jgi:hypothetical protein
VITAKRLFSRGLCRAFLSIGLVLALAGILPAAAGAAAPATPHWKIMPHTSPTRFFPGDKSGSALYDVFVTNTGAAPTDGSPITITSELPTGLSVNTSVNSPPFEAIESREGPYPCVVGPPASCTLPNKVIYPGEIVLMWLPVNIDASVSGIVNNHMTISGGGAAEASYDLKTLVSAEQPKFGFEGLENEIAGPDGAPFTQAGGHPYRFHTGFQLNTTFNREPGVENSPAGSPKEVVAKLPPGLIVNPAAAPRCTEVQLEANGRPQCPAGSAVGEARVTINPLGFSTDTNDAPLYNMVPPPGYAAAFAFDPEGYGFFIHLLGGVDSEGNFALTSTSKALPQAFRPSGVRVDLWGSPTDPSHDRRRGPCAYPSGGTVEDVENGCKTERRTVPFVTMPSACSPDSLNTSYEIKSWEKPMQTIEATTSTEDEDGNPLGVDGCNALEFDPAISSQPTTNLADSPSGLDFNIHQPQAPVVEQGTGVTNVCTIGTWANKPTEYAFQWLHNGVPISGATSNSYVPTEEDATSSLQCEVKATNPAAIQPGKPNSGSAYAASEASTVLPAPAVAPPVVGTPTISILAINPADPPGTKEKATCNPGSWGGEPSFSFEWFKDGEPLSGETTEAIEFEKQAPGSKRFALQCKVTGANAGGAAVAYSSTVESAQGEPVANPIPNPTRGPQLSIDEAQIPLATAILKDVKVALPPGLTLNPSAGNGLSACDESQIGYQPSGGEIHFSANPQSCPAASKLGTMEVSTPLLEAALPGEVYLAKPYDNPFGSMLALYLAIEDPDRGIVAKLAGKVVADPQTGQLTTTFTENPQLPIEDIDLHIFNGPRAALKTSLTCGRYTTETTLTPWSTPEGADAHPSDSFETTFAAGGGGNCPRSEGQAPNSLSFVAGTLAPQAGAYSPFLLKFTRPDGSQRLTGIDTTLPKGLTAKLAGTSYCSEAQINQAKSREAPNQGAVEQAHPSCPSSSEVGSVTVGAGAGISPLYVEGRAYLAGPYKGAPLSMVIVTPAVSGPFDLGTVVTRAALFLNPETAQAHAVSDPLPSIIDGVQLDVRSIALKLDKPDFTLNPTSCDPAQVTASALALTGQSVSLNSPFQVGNCKALNFAPKLAVHLKGGTKRNKNPALRAVVTYPKGQNANILTAQVTLPHSEFLDQSHIGTVCTRVQFAADQCPSASIYGKARAYTPLLDDPVEGPVYLRSSSHELPDLVAALHGQVDVDLVGRVDTGKGGGIRNTFEGAPDAPVSKFVLEMQGGKKGLLVNSENICRKPQKALATYTAQNGKAYKATPTIGNDCKKKHKKKKHHKKSGKGR